MTTLGDRATENVDVTLAGDLIESEYQLPADVEQLADVELLEADKITGEGEFPQYGVFLKVKERSPYDGQSRGETHIEVPQALASWIVDGEAQPGDYFAVDRSRKKNGTWQFDVSVIR